MSKKKQRKEGPRWPVEEAAEEKAKEKAEAPGKYRSQSVQKRRKKVQQSNV